MSEQKAKRLAERIEARTASYGNPVVIALILEILPVILKGCKKDDVTKEKLSKFHRVKKRFMIKKAEKAGYSESVAGPIVQALFDEAMLCDGTSLAVACDTYLED